jgi:transposase
MAYRYGNRRQEVLFPGSIEEYVAAEAPVRAYDAFVEALDFCELGIELDSCRVGNSTYDPRAMLKLLVYGYSYGVRSSRKLEREAHYNLSFIWLLGGLKPDHKTIAEFRRKHRVSLRRVLKQSVRMCLELGLIAGNTLFVDGSKLRANASLNQQWTQARCQKWLVKIDDRIEEILAECERADEAESDDGSLVRIDRELAVQGKLKSKVKAILEQLRESEKETINSTDPDCVRTRGRHGSDAGYNLQMVVDVKEGLIIHSDVVNANNDLGQLADQLEQAEEVLVEPVTTVCADAGYCQYEDLEKLDRQGIKVIVPSKNQASRKVAKPFQKSEFRYQSENDVYTCPAGQILSYQRPIGQKKKEYRTGKGVCRQCRYFGECTTDRKNGRLLVRYVNEEFRERLACVFEQPDSRAIYGLRKQKSELPFGHIKRNLHADHFLLRRLAGVRAEASLLATSFNIARLITLISVPMLIQKLAH